MPHVTTILGNEAGIQYQGVKDASSVLGVPLINGLIIGQFKRGRLDRPMTITLENIRGTLGHDPANPDYIAVMDALSAGVPSVQVMRVGESGSGAGDAGGDATCAWLSSSDFSGIIESWQDSEFEGLMVSVYMDSLDQFNSTIDQIQSIKVDYVESEEQNSILSIDFSPWIDEIKAEAKQQFNNQPDPFQVIVTQYYSIEDMSAPQPIIDALNTLSSYMPESAYYARVSVVVMFWKTVENQYIVGVYPDIEFLSHDANSLWIDGVTTVYQACFKGDNIAAFMGEYDYESGTAIYLKQPDSVLNSLEGTRWLKSQGGFTVIDAP